jgi:3-phenylpropionate/trans-cinnamate dioxygenase ferredoxin subunit
MRYEVCASDDIDVGEAFRFTTVEPPIAVIRGESGTVFAIDDTCTHADASFCDGFVEGDSVECPLHMSVFCLKTGAPENPPATQPVNVYLVEESEGKIFIEVNR